MKIDEFIKYKKLIESDGYIPNDQAEKVYQWLEETGRIDEGFFGAVWRWIKRHISPTARKLYSLADEYEKELTAEIKAEWDTLQYKTIADKWRKGSYMRLSNDIEKRMDIVAGEDSDYRELAKVLINKKDLKVKRLLLTHFTSKLDPDEVSQETRNLDSEDRKNAIKERSLINEDPKEHLQNVQFLKKKLGEDRRFGEKANIKSDKEKESFVGTIVLYVKKLSKVDKGIKNDTETIFKFAKRYVETVVELSGKIESSTINKNEAIEIVKDELNDLLRQEKPLRFEDVKSYAMKNSKEAADKVKAKSDDEESEVPDPNDLDSDVVTPNTDKVLKTDDVEQAVKDAAEETGKQKPTSDEVSEEIKDTVKKYFENSVEVILERLVSEVNEFNSKTDSERQKLKNEFDYELDSNGKLTVPTLKELKLLVKDFIEIAGKIVPYYEYGEKTVRYASAAVADKLFQIYAVKKDVNGRLSQDNIEDIIYAIKKNQ